MAGYTDSLGRVFLLDLTGKTVILTKRKLGINLYALCDGGEEGRKAHKQLFGDVEYFAQVLAWCMAEPAPDVLDVAAGLKGDAFYDAQNAFVEALLEFLPDPTIRRVLQEVYRDATKMTSMTATDRQLHMNRILTTYIGDSSSSQPSADKSQKAAPIAN